MIIKLTMLSILLLLLLASAPAVKADAWVRDGSNIIAEEGILSRELQGLYDTKDIIIILETFQELEDAKTVGKKNFKKYGLDKIGNGNPMLNLYIIYVNASNSLKIFYGSKCGIPPQMLDNTMKKETVSGKIAEGRYDEAFSNLIDALESIITEKLAEGLKCAMEIEKSRIEFTIDPRVYEPPSKENPYGRNMDREENPYGDGVVTEYDPLVCILHKGDSGIAGDVLYRISGTKSGLISSDTARCNKERCTATLAPGKTKRGEKLVCTMRATGGSSTYQASVTVAQYVYIFIPMTHPDVPIEPDYSNIREQYEFYVELSAINDKQEWAGRDLYSRICVINNKGFLKEWDQFKRFENKPQIKALVDIIRLGLFRDNVNKCGKQMGFVWDPEFDRVVGFNLLYDNSVANSKTKEVFLSSPEERSLAHELGHTYSWTAETWMKHRSLCDEYSGISYLFQQNCINKMPSCCLNYFGGIRDKSNVMYDYQIERWDYQANEDYTGLSNLCSKHGGGCIYSQNSSIKCNDDEIPIDSFNTEKPKPLIFIEKVISWFKDTSPKKMWSISATCPYVKGEKYGLCCMKKSFLAGKGTDCWGEERFPPDIEGYYDDGFCAGSPLPDKSDLSSDIRSIYGYRGWPGSVRYPPETGLPMNPQ